MKWWHVLSGDEDVLSILDNNWEHVEVQTSWHIEPCLIASGTNELPEAVNVASADEPPSSFLVDKSNSPTPTLAFVAPQESGQERLQAPSSLPMPNAKAEFL